jgi:Icc-related predicted phosphoesterase
MRILHISDTHTYHDLLKIPSGIDMIIHSGDCSNPRDPYNNESEVRDFIDWYKEIPVKHKIYVAGNHDTSIEKGLVTKDDFKNAGIIYLENESVVIDGIKIFGSPHTPNFGNWAFMKERTKLERFWRLAIDEDVNIVVTHGPPKGILDKSYDRENNLECCGDKSLLNRILEVQPTYSLFGHIHNCKDIVNAGIQKLSVCNTFFSNGSVVTDGRFGKLSSNGNLITI